MFIRFCFGSWELGHKERVFGLDYNF
jgi:hypothetical protein